MILNMRKLFFGLIAACCIAIVGCNTGKVKRNGDFFFFPEVHKAIQKPETDLFLSDIGKAVRYIQLEKREGYFLSRINKTYLINDLIFISDNLSVIQFDKNGAIIRRFGAVGRGPGEFLTPIRFSVDPVLEEVLIYSTTTSELNVYDLSTGEFKFGKRLPFYVSNFGALSNGNRFFFTQEFLHALPFSTINEVYFTDKELNLIDSIGNPLRKSNESNSVGFVSCFVHDETIFYLYNYRDTLYQISQDLIRTPYAVFEIQNEISRDQLQVFPQEGQILFPDFLWISRVVGNSDFLFVDFSKGFSFDDKYSPVKFVFNKNKGKYFISQGFSNDLDGGPPFWPRWVSDGKLINYFLPHEIIDHYSHTKGKVAHDQAFLHLVRNLNENGNPVLVILE